MKHEYLMEMSESELANYAQACGIDISKAKGHAAKVELIESARERTAELSTIGMKLVIPIKNLHDKRVSDMLSALDISNNADVELAMRAILGDAQFEALVKHCTEDDGYVDIDALGTAIHAVLSSQELKNF
ncbi:MAG: hypothetical protein IJ125_05005 [Atopobiaceae bacterium]|nr:hypothetical protein [Atopobiaceae bacterium]